MGIFLFKAQTVLNPVDFFVDVYIIQIIMGMNGNGIEFLKMHCPLLSPGHLQIQNPIFKSATQESDNGSDTHMQYT